MPITFTPRRSAILMCDFRFGHIPPEIGKKRRVVVVSPTGRNTWLPYDPGVSVVVPLSVTAPRGADPRCVAIPLGRYKSLTADVWAKCGMIATVSNARLDRVFARGTRQGDYVTAVDMAAIEAAIRVALELP